MQHSLLILTPVELQDLRTDDMGSWHPTGTKKSYFRFSDSEYFVITLRSNTMTSLIGRLLTSKTCMSLCGVIV